LAAALVLLFTIVGAARAAEPNYPALSGRVVDEAGVLSASTKSGLAEMLAQHERSSGGQQVVVVTLKSLQGLTIEDFGYQLGRHWGIGQKDKNTGALLIVAPAERKVRIEVGYGLEGTLTDALARSIIERDIVPAFKRGDLNGGVLAGTASIIRVLGGDASAPEATTEWKAGAQDAVLPFLIFMAIWIFFASMVARQARHYDPLRHRYYYVWPAAFLGGSGGSGGFSGGGGGFSGGGGSFGGGGASGSW
jgi:uncharacterized protein